MTVKQLLLYILFSCLKNYISCLKIKLHPLSNDEFMHACKYLNELLFFKEIKVIPEHLVLINILLDSSAK